MTYQLIENSGKLQIRSKLTGALENIHQIHCAETLSEIKEDVYSPFVVVENCTNFSFIHLVTAENEDIALNDVYDYLSEKSDNEETPILLQVLKLSI